MKLPLWLGYIVAIILSLLAAFFAVVNVLFSDVAGVQQQYGAIGYVFLTYTIISAILYWLWWGGWVWFWWLVIPGLVLGGFFLVNDGSAIGWYPATVLVAVIIATWLGRFMATQIVKKRFS